MHALPARIPPFVAPFAILVAFACGCSLLLSTSLDQCGADSDCAARGAGFEGMSCVNHVCVASAGDGGQDSSNSPWACLGNVSRPPANKSTVSVTVPFVDLVQNTPVADLTITTCNKLDADCTNPIGEGAKPNDQGIVTLSLTAGFDGYLFAVSTVTDEAGGPGSMPAIVFFNPPLIDDTVYPTIFLVSPSSLQGLAVAVGVTLDPQLGAAVYGAMDCSASFAAGVSSTVNRTTDSTKAFFFENNVPTDVATATDSSGFGGFVNVPTGYVTLDAVVQATGSRIGSAGLLIRPSCMSYTFLVPSP